jgi:hypothetical protein
MGQQVKPGRGHTEKVFGAFKPEVQMGTPSAHAIRASRNTHLHQQAVCKSADLLEPSRRRILLSWRRPGKKPLGKLRKSASCIAAERELGRAWAMSINGL